MLHQPLEQLMVEVKNPPWKTPEEYNDFEMKILKMIISREYLTTESKVRPLVILDKNSGDRKYKPEGVTVIRITGLYDCLLSPELEFANIFGRDIVEETKVFFPGEQVSCYIEYFDGKRTGYWFDGKVGLLSLVKQA